MNLRRAVTRLAATLTALAATAFPSSVASGQDPVVGDRDGHKLVVRELASFGAPDCAAGCGAGSTIGPDGALYVTDGERGRVLRVDSRSGRVTTFANGLPPTIPEVGLGGAIDVVFLRGTAYVLVTLVGPEFGQPDVVAGAYRIDRHGRPTAIADVGAWSTAHPPQTDFFVASGVQYALEKQHGRLLVSDGHHNRLLRVSRGGDIEEFRAFDNVVPTGLEVHRGGIYLAQAGPLPHRPEDGRVMRFAPTAPSAEVAAGAPLLVDVERGSGNRLYALSQGVWDLPPTPENEGKPASPHTGQLLLARWDGRLVPVVEGLDRPTSVEVRGDTAWVVTLTGKVIRIDGLTCAP